MGAQGDTRVPTLKAIVRALFKAARRLNTSRFFSLYRYGGDGWPNLMTDTDVESALTSIQINGGSYSPDTMKTWCLTHSFSEHTGGVEFHCRRHNHLFRV
jgi:hypothetical protein